MNIFIGVETSGVFRQRFQALGHFVISVDYLPSEDGAGFGGWEPEGGHIEGDVFDEFAFQTRKRHIEFDFAIFHPECTFHTLSAAWAFKDPDYVKYPDVGYHQQVRPGTKVGADRRAARAEAERDCEKIQRLPLRRKVIENPRGTLPTRTTLGKFDQVVQPYDFGDDASKATCLWYFDENGNHVKDLTIPIDPAARCPGRMIEWHRGSGKFIERWSNQTDAGQSNVTPSNDRWKNRSRTYPGLADAAVAHWNRVLTSV